MTKDSLPLTWEHTRAIQRLARFFARLYRHVLGSDDKVALGKYENWMTTLFQMIASIQEGTQTKLL